MPGKLRLRKNERAWLGAYCHALKAAHADAVEELLVFGSKARGTACPDSDLDLLLIVKSPAASIKRKLRRIGYALAAGSDVVPSILAYTAEEWEQRRRSGSPFRQAVERDKVRVL
jgi:predicted nucleotidyltransferase